MSKSGVSNFAYMWRALQSRNYRLFFSGQIISLMGNWITRIALSWLVWKITDSELLLGLVAFAGQIPTFLLAPIAGVWIDRLNRHHLIIATQALAMVQSFLVAILTLTGVINVWHILLLTIFQGLINAFDMPARQTFVVEMVERKEDLTNAIALNSSIVNLARMVGPALGGFIIVLVGEGWCFFIDGVSYIAVIISLLMMHVSSSSNAVKKSSAISELKDGFRYVYHFAPIRYILTLLALVSLVATPYTVLMPIFSSEVLNGDSATLGLLMGAVGVGALIGAITMAARKSVAGVLQFVPLTSIIFGIGLIGFSFSPWLTLSMPLLVLVGFGSMMQMTASNTLLQTIVDDDKRGRVMSIYAMSFMGTIPIGSLLAGAVSHQIGVQYTVLISGICCLGGAIWFIVNLPKLYPELRPIYQRLGVVEKWS